MIDLEDAVLIEKTSEGIFQVRVKADEHTFLMDEPAAFGGLSSGPSPFDRLCAALGACTIMTMELYAKKKGWALDGVDVRITHKKGSPDARDQFERVIHLPNVTDEQRTKLLSIAERCPVHLLLERGADVRTTFAEGELLGPKGEGLHERVIDELCRGSV